MPPKSGEGPMTLYWKIGPNGEYSKIGRIKELTIDFDIPKEDKDMKHEGKILIMVDENDENKVIATDLTTGVKAEAKCNPTDDWDFQKGAVLAFDRLLEKTKLWNGRVVCVEDKNAGPFFVKGKVYTVKNGVIYDEHSNYGNDFRVKSVDDLNRKMREFGGRITTYAWAQFIEYKGGADE